MKNLISILLFAFVSQSINALTIQELSVSPISDTDINVHLKVMEGYYFEYSSHSYTIENNTITLTICYLPITLSMITTKENDFIIPDINTQTNEYVIIVNVNHVHIVEGQQVCDYQIQSDAATIAFTTPLNTTVNLSSNTFDNNQSGITIFPNPTKRTIQFNYDNNKISKIRVLDSLGRIVKEFHSINTKSIDLLGLEDGIYYLEFNTDLEKFSRKIILKN